MFSLAIFLFSFVIDSRYIVFFVDSFHHFSCFLLAVLHSEVWIYSYHDMHQDDKVCLLLWRRTSRKMWCSYMTWKWQGLKHRIRGDLDLTPRFKYQICSDMDKLSILKYRGIKGSDILDTKCLMKFCSYLDSLIGLGGRWHRWKKSSLLEDFFPEWDSLRMKSYTWYIAKCIIISHSFIQEIIFLVSLLKNVTEEEK